MTEEEFLAYWAGVMQMTVEKMHADGFFADPCYCQGKRPNCCGWQLGFRGLTNETTPKQAT